MNDRLREERLRRGWTQTRLSALTGIASPDLSAIERGRRPVFAGWRRRLAEVFGVPEVALFGESGTEAERRAESRAAGTEAA
jgi:transcriptional regulator with XRE-family HTH domain